MGHKESFLVRRSSHRREQPAIRGKGHFEDRSLVGVIYWRLRPAHYLTRMFRGLPRKGYFLKEGNQTEEENRAEQVERKEIGSSRLLLEAANRWMGSDRSVDGLLITLGCGQGKSKQRLALGLGRFADN